MGAECKLDIAYLQAVKQSCDRANVIPMLEKGIRSLEEKLKKDMKQPSEMVERLNKNYKTLYGKEGTDYQW